MNNENIPNETIQMQPGQTTPTPPRQPAASSRAIAALVLGILAILCCGFFCGIPGIIVGKMELNAIKRGESDVTGQTLAMVGFILSIIGTALSCLGFILYAGMMIFGISLGIMENMQST